MMPVYLPGEQQSAVLTRLLQILADGCFHSGTELAQVLSLSRTAVWKYVQALEGLGLEVVGITGKGYRLATPLHLLSAQQIEAALSPDVRGLLQELTLKTLIDSTNAYLMALAQQSPASGRVCLAEYQTAGKGRRGRHWVSPFGHNIYLSVLWSYQQGAAALAGLSLAVGVAVVRALKQMGLSEAGLKWPNDIYWQDRKLGGILIEVSGESNGPCHAVVGLGLNVYLPQQAALGIEQAWVDLRQILGEQVLQQRNELVAGLLNQLLPVIAAYETQGLAAFIEEWRTYDCLHGRQIQLQVGEQCFTGVSQGIDAQGLLLIEQSSAQVRTFASGEVSVRPL